MTSKKSSHEKKHLKKTTCGQYDPHNDLTDKRLIKAMSLCLTPLIKYFRTELVNTGNVPKESGCLCVSNHAIMGIDTLILYLEYFRKTGRVIRGLADHFFFQQTLIGELMMRFGAVDGNRDNAVKLLKAGNLMLCYPGGADESFGTNGEHYTLKWQGRMGYLRSAIAAGVPVLPIASIGAEDAYLTLFREPFIGRRLFGSPKYDFPVFTGLGLMPLPVKFRYIFDKPIDLKKRFGLKIKDAKASDKFLAPIHQEIWQQTQRLIDVNRK